MFVFDFQRHLGAAIIAAGAQLVELDLSDNAFGPDGVKAVQELVESKACYTLKQLRFNNNGLGIGGKVRPGLFLHTHLLVVFYGLLHLDYLV